MTSWYCDICDKTINIKSKSKHMYSKSHEHKEKLNVFVKKYELFRPDINKVDYKNINCAGDCYTKNFHTI